MLTNCIILVLVLLFWLPGTEWWGSDENGRAYGYGPTLSLPLHQIRFNVITRTRLLRI